MVAVPVLGLQVSRPYCNFRTFPMEYDSDETVRGIKTYAYKVQNDSYDSTSEEFRGYRYENPERKVEKCYFNILGFLSQLALQ